MLEFPETTATAVQCSDDLVGDDYEGYQGQEWTAQGPCNHVLEHPVHSRGPIQQCSEPPLTQPEEQQRLWEDMRHLPDTCRG